MHSQVPKYGTDWYNLTWYQWRVWFSTLIEIFIARYYFNVTLPSSFPFLLKANFTVFPNKWCSHHQQRQTTPSTMMKKTTKCTHVDILQVQKVKYDAVPLPDDWRAQRPLDGTRKDGTKSHCYRGDADPLVLCQAQLDNLCQNESTKGND